MKKNFGKRHLRKFAALLLAVLVCAGIAAQPVFAAQRGDGVIYHQDEPEWAVESINWFIRHPGYLDIKAPSSAADPGPGFAERTMSRRWLCQLIYSMERRDQQNLGGKGPGNGEPRLPDGSQLPDGSLWISKAVICFGTKEGNVPQNDKSVLTREQMVTIVHRYMQYRNKIYQDGAAKGLTGAALPAKYKDRNRVSAFAREAMEWAVGNGIVGGKTAATLNPRDTATEAETIVVLYRALRQQGYETPGA